MMITNQEEILAGKPAFEKQADTFGVKIKRYHADNGIFSKQTFRSEIKDTNQNITFYGVVSHHQIQFLKEKFKL